MAVVSADFEVVVGSGRVRGDSGDERLEDRRQRGRRRSANVWRAFWRSPVTYFAGPLLLLIVWQLMVTVAHVPVYKLPSPWSVLSTLKQLSANGELWSALSISLRRVVLGLLLGVAVGSGLALASGLSQMGQRLIDPVMHMFRTMPVLALLAVFIVWFGIGEKAKVYIIAWAVLFPIYINLYAGVRGVDAKLVEAGDVLGLRRWGQIRHVILPGALPQFLTGLRLSLSLAWIVLVAAEEINATSGLGTLITNAQNLEETNVIFAVLLVFSLLGVASDLLVRLIERWALSWRSSYVTK